jgi:DNA topoisomerase-1
MNVVVVESPAKAKTINRYLGSDFKVIASYGHVRDLPPKDGSVRPDDDFAMSWQVAGKSQKNIDEIMSALRGAKHLYLATDPDREGEAISWHVQQILAEKKVLDGISVQRVVLHAITKTAILEASTRIRRITHSSLSRAARPGLSGRVHALTRVMAKASGFPLGGPGSIGVPAAYL